VPLRFLTLTSKNVRGDVFSRDLEHLIEDLRAVYGSLEYMATRTDEGRGVYHLALVSDYLPWATVKTRWQAITGASRVHISFERDFHAILEEMTRQQETRRYSFSRGFLPDGSRDAIEAICRQFTGKIRYQAIKQLARRWKAPAALIRTQACVERGPGPGRYSDIRTRQEYFTGGVQADIPRSRPFGSESVPSLRRFATCRNQMTLRGVKT
jgi:hypothetical protein